jgi:hypothetical protein
MDTGFTENFNIDIIYMYLLLFCLRFFWIALSKGTKYVMSIILKGYLNGNEDLFKKAHKTCAVLRENVTK